MKFLFWQFALYAISAFALGFVAAWSWFREQVREVGTALERTRARVADAQDARHQLQEARATAATAKESLEILRERFTDSETVRAGLEVEVHSLRNGRMKLLTELSELRSSLDSAAVSRTHLTSAQHEAGRLRVLLDDASEQLRTERAAREQTLAVLKARLADVELELATYRHAVSPGSGSALDDLAEDAGYFESSSSIPGRRPNNLIPFVGSSQVNAFADPAFATADELPARSVEPPTGSRVGWSARETPGSSTGMSAGAEGGARILDLRGDNAAAKPTGD